MNLDQTSENTVRWIEGIGEEETSDCNSYFEGGRGKERIEDFWNMDHRIWIVIGSETYIISKKIETAVISREREFIFRSCYYFIVIIFVNLQHGNMNSVKLRSVSIDAVN